MQENIPAANRERLRLSDSIRSVSFGRKLWFAVSFVVPVLAGALYLMLIAPDQYVTEYRFSVRVPVGQTSQSGSSGASLAALFGGNQAPGSDHLDNYTIADYVGSGQAAHDLNAKVNLGQMYNRPSDPFSRIGSDPSAERVADYWHKMVYSNYDVASGLAIVRVKAFTAQDSYAIATSLVGLSSDLINAIGVQSQQDSVRFAQQQLDRANVQVSMLRGQLAMLRHATNVVDPTKGGVDGGLALVSELRNRRSLIATQLESLRQRLQNPQAPQLAVLGQQLASVDAQIEQAQQNDAAGASAPNMPATVGRFEEIDARLKNAMAVQATANSTLAIAQTSADSQRVYLSTYVKPTMPQSPEAPRRWEDLLLVTLVAGMIWLIGRLIGASIMEHA